jgi:predicted ribosomally synthesized peptide with nif11-like leader
MSIDAVNKFWGRFSSDSDFRTKVEGQRKMTLGQIVEFGGKHGFTFTEDDLKAVATTSGELSDSQLEGVAGGVGFDLSLYHIQNNIRLQIQNIGKLGGGWGPIAC